MEKPAVKAGPFRRERRMIRRRGYRILCAFKIAPSVIKPADVDSKVDRVEVAEVDMDTVVYRWAPRQLLRRLIIAECIVPLEIRTAQSQKALAKRQEHLLAEKGATRDDVAVFRWEGKFQNRAGRRRIRGLEEYAEFRANQARIDDTSRDYLDPWETAEEREDRLANPRAHQRRTQPWARMAFVPQTSLSRDWTPPVSAREPVREYRQPPQHPVVAEPEATDARKKEIKKGKEREILALRPDRDQKKQSGGFVQTKTLEELLAMQYSAPADVVQVGEAGTSLTPFAFTFGAPTKPPEVKAKRSFVPYHQKVIPSMAALPPVEKDESETKRERVKKWLRNPGA